MIRHIHYNHLHGEVFFPGITLLMAICLTLSCKQRSQQVQMDESAFVFGTEHIDGDAADYSRPAVITGTYRQSGGVCEDSRNQLGNPVLRPRFRQTDIGHL